ncbi:hypothetical protein [Streptomyces sp. NPDC058678]|uniref:hypothetical protein n=1 Tax=Streptomyces sp. NPDC058678 TaxID=3346595 RepID=UPI003664786C
MTFVIAVGLVPFLQSIATQVAQRSFDTAHAMIRERCRSGGGQVSGPHLVMQEPGGRMEFRVPRTSLMRHGMEALVALGADGLEDLAEQDPHGQTVTVAWNADSRDERPGSVQLPFAGLVLGKRAG